MSQVDRAEGYVVDTRYADTFFQELSPTRLNYVAALAGARTSDLSCPFTYLELGCGLGTSSVVHAGCFRAARFHACDVNPAHIEAAAALRDAYGVSNLELHGCSFDELLEVPLPQFDFIVAHGVYSWVGEGARAALLRIVEARLKPGGLLYLSYNCQPGWAAEAPLRRWLVELAEQGSGSTLERIEQAVQLSGELRSLRYFQENPAALRALEARAGDSASYLAHEFFNQAWEPLYAVDVFERLAPLGLRQLGSATLSDNHPPLLIDDATATKIARLPSERLRTLAFDFALQRRFRRDVFVRAAHAPAAVDVARAMGVVLLGSRVDTPRLPVKVRVPRGEISFREDFVRELGALLAEGARPIAALVSALARGKHDPAEIARNLVYMVAAGSLMPFAIARGPTAPLTGARQPSPSTLRVLEHAASHDRVGVVPSAWLGTGISVEPEDARALCAYAQGATSLEALAARLSQRSAGPAPLPATQSEALAQRVFGVLLPTLERAGLLT